jgi:hypothetical protein
MREDLNICDIKGCGLCNNEMYCEIGLNVSFR